MTSPSAQTRSIIPWRGVALLGIVAGAILRFIEIGHKSLWMDEGYTAWMSSNSCREIIRLIRADTAPPLYYLVLHAWTEVFGRSEAGLRSLSAVLSIFSLLGVFAIARRLLRSPAHVALVVWLVVLGFQQQFYAQEARAYALMAFFAVTAFYLLLRHLAVSHRRWLLPISIVLAASLYTHNMMAPYVVSLLVPWLMLPSEHSLRRRIMDASIAAGFTLILYLPWAATSLVSQLRMVHQSFWVQKPGVIDVLTIFGWVAGFPRFDDWNHVLYSLHSPRAMGTAPAWFGLMLILLCAILAMLNPNRLRRREAISLFSFLLIPPVIVMLYSLFGQPILMDKIFLPSATLMPVALVMAMKTSPDHQAGSRARWIGCAAAICMLLISSSTLALYFKSTIKEQWRDAARFVQDMPARRRLIVFSANDGQAPFDYYYHYRNGEVATGAPAGLFQRDPPRTMLRVSTPADIGPLEAEIERGNYRETVLVLSHWDWADPNGYVLQMLQRHFKQEKHKRFYRVSVYRYDP